MGFADHIRNTMAKRRRLVMNDITAARCFRKVPITQDYRKFAENQFVVWMAERLDRMCEEPGFVTPALMHTGIYFAKVFQGSDYRTRLLSYFARAFFDVSCRCVKRLANAKPQSADDTRLMWLCARRLIDVYANWYDAQTKISSMTCDAVRVCSKSRQHLANSAALCARNGFTVNAQRMSEAVGKITDVVQRFYDLIIFEEHKVAATEAELDVQTNYKCAEQPMLELYEVAGEVAFAEGLLRSLERVYKG
jgi:hypothetical protein